MGLLGGLGFAAIFYFAAEYEHLTGWKWALASVALSITVRALFPLSFIFVLPAQFGLFGVLWWANLRHRAAREIERETAREADQRLRQERAKLAREKTDPDPARAAREAAAAAQEEAARLERQERVRRAREQREREEREQREKQPPQ